MIAQYSQLGSRTSIRPVKDGLKAILNHSQALVGCNMSTDIRGHKATQPNGGGGGGGGGGGRGGEKKWHPPRHPQVCLKHVNLSMNSLSSAPSFLFSVWSVNPKKKKRKLFYNRKLHSCVWVTICQENGNFAVLSYVGVICFPRRHSDSTTEIIELYRLKRAKNTHLLKSNIHQQLALSCFHVIKTTTTTKNKEKSMSWKKHVSNSKHTETEMALQKSMLLLRLSQYWTTLPREIFQRQRNQRQWFDSLKSTEYMFFSQKIAVVSFFSFFISFKLVSRLLEKILIFLQNILGFLLGKPLRNVPRHPIHVHVQTMSASLFTHIDPVGSYKYLGIHIDSKLSVHLEHVCPEASPATQQYLALTQT